MSADKDEAAWKRLLELAMPLCEVHPFFGMLVKELSDLEAEPSADTAELLRFDTDFERIVRDAKALVEVCLDDRYKSDYSTAERYREAHYDAALCFDNMRYGELATEEIILDHPAYDSAYNYSVEMLRQRQMTTALREVLYPHTLRDLYNYLKAYCLRLPLVIHKCKDCGRYFVVTGNIAQEYCTRRMDGSEKTCRQMGAVVQYQSRQMKNPATKEFTRSYKAHNARVRYGTMTKAEFTAWSKEARYTLGIDPKTGRQIQKSVYGKTQKEVRQKLTAITAEIDDGTYQEPCRMTLDEWLDIWLRDYLTGVKPSTAYLYQRQAKLYIRPAACILPKIIKRRSIPWMTVIPPAFWKPSRAAGMNCR